MSSSWKVTKDNLSTKYAHILFLNKGSKSGCVQTFVSNIEYLSTLLFPSILALLPLWSQA